MSPQEDHSSIRNNNRDNLFYSLIFFKIYTSMKNKIIYSFLVIKEKISMKMKAIQIYFLLHIFSKKLDTKMQWLN